MPIIQRYMPGEIALKVLNDNGLYFRRLDSLSADPTEGDRKIYGSIEKKICDVLHFNKDIAAQEITEDDVAEASLQLMEYEKKNKFIQCWHSSNKTSPLMWRNFTSGNQDCAVFIANRFHLASYLSSTIPIGFDFRKIKYVEDKYKETNTDFIKHVSFKHEKEIRILINLRMLTLYNGNILKNTYNGTQYSGPINIGENLTNNGISDENLFIDVDDKGFIMKAPLNKIITNILIPNTASVHFEKRINSHLSSNGYSFMSKRVNTELELDIN